MSLSHAFPPPSARLLFSSFFLQIDAMARSKSPDEAVLRTSPRSTGESPNHNRSGGMKPSRPLVSGPYCGARESGWPPRTAIKGRVLETGAGESAEVTATIDGRAVCHDLHVEPMREGSSISREDVAVFLVDEILSPKHPGEQVFVHG